MKQAAILAILFILLAQPGRGQDLVVTVKGDSLNCSIMKITGDYIYFTQGESKKSVSMPLSQVKDYRKGFYIARVEQSGPAVPVQYDRIRMGVYGGWSYLTGKVSDDVPEEFRSYVADLKTGYHFGADFLYFFNGDFGMGLKYTLFRTTNEISPVYAIDTVTQVVRTGKLRDDITIQYIGPSFGARLKFPNQGVYFITEASLGYQSYRNEVTVIDEFTLSSSTVGLFLDMGFDINIHKNVSLGLFASYSTGTLKYYRYIDARENMLVRLTKEEYSGINRIDLSAGLRWTY
jgi:hypothetical protein